MLNTTKILVAGVGGASLGTEIIKALFSAGCYEIYCCDISPFAYGHYMDCVADSFLVRRDHYIDDILALCRGNGISMLIPGGDEPSVIIGKARARFDEAGIAIGVNTPEVIALCSDKAMTFQALAEHGVSMPKTISVQSLEDLGDAPVPCVIKPATGTGGSNMVFLANDRKSQRSYASYVLESNDTAVIQEYIGLDEGEVTIGVLHSPQGKLVGSIALKRMFHAKLSVFSRTEHGLISSGYSQGLIDEFAELRKQAEDIATLIGSKGPLNIQGRVRDGKLLPFEINPRFSATTYLRTLAGFNEVDLFIRMLQGGETPGMPEVKYGYYFRSLDETYVPFDGVKQ